MFIAEVKEMLLTSVSAGKLAGVLPFESYDSNFVWSAFSRDRSDSAAHAQLLAQSQQEKSF